LTWGLSWLTFQLQLGIIAAYRSGITDVWNARVLKGKVNKNSCNLGLDQLRDAPVCPSF